MIMLVGEDGDGVFDLGMQQRLDDGKPFLREKPAYLLKRPLKIGAQWKTEAIQSLTRLWAKVPKPPAMVPQTATIEFLDEAVTVPAGTYKAVRVAAMGRLRTAAEMVSWFTPGHPSEPVPATLSITTYSWYVPGIGLIKRIHREEVQSRYPVENMAEWKWELESYTQ